MDRPSLRRHGDWPLYVPPDQPDEAWWLAEQIAAPITSGECTCEAMCVCPSEVAP